MSLVSIPWNSYTIVDLTHHERVVKRDLYLCVLPDDVHGKNLDVPEVIDVRGFKLYEHEDSPAFESSYEAGTLSSAAGSALCREFNARLKTDENLRQWLIAATFEALLERPVRKESAK